MALTLRLTDEEENALINIKESLGCKTLNATIKSMIALHGGLAKRLDEMTLAANVATQERDAIKEEVATYLTAQNNLTKMISPEWHGEIVDRLDAHEQGRSVTYSREETRGILKEHLHALRN